MCFTRESGQKVQVGGKQLQNIQGGESRSVFEHTTMANHLLSLVVVTVRGIG